VRSSGDEDLLDPHGEERGNAARLEPSGNRTRKTLQTAVLANSYSETVCTTLLTGRRLVTGTFASLISASSYSARVSSGILAFI
jgi:hypothetical protein